ncbi:MAG: type II toxin-antitoxin system HicB family antitoxin [bacterium]|nr:type II toxin-antitoxin system HicB family antitoxin [bacterium]
MIQEYLNEKLAQAKYEIIDDGRTYYGEIPGSRGVWAAGKTLEECRGNILATLEDWLIFRLKKQLNIPGLRSSNIGRNSRKVYA